MSDFEIRPATEHVYNNGSPRISEHGEARRGEHSLEWRRWVAMITRCTNPKASNYARYGGRGIKVCDRWIKSYSDFLNDMGRAPSAEHTLDRINNDGDYEPGNCKWSTKEDQQNNRRNTLLIEHEGKKLSATQWSQIVRIPAKRILHRVKHGWPVAEALTTLPTKENRKHYAV